ncbi:IPT/TIG domain-containing protein [Leifsonia sp. ZF2019]|uniref:IPT/TIG domain-containing protein n=1 Tax=Leifsonia sp. ZF2019 TaxID=2781978 RepID=UPI001CC1AB6C|nr:IPT/TIG domain-containing protein [Leifsonia sp. ZF2019]UAJ80151.1 IPT/TIG domain-containing protein [Leifsonia sp. ZF2019]
MSDTSIYDATVPTEGSVALAHQQIIRVKRAGAFENITGDVNNLLDTTTPVTVKREVYGTKGTDSSDVIGLNHVVTFDCEAVRDDNGAIIQPWLKALLVAARSKGAANKVDAQLFDALDGSIDATEGTFAVAVVPLNTGYADKGGYKFTLTSDGVVRDVPSPVAGDGKPSIESVPTPNGKTVGDQLVIRGYNLGTVTAGTIDGQAIAKITIVDANTIVIVIPATVAGAAPIILTNPNGASAAFNGYTAA